MVNSVITNYRAWTEAESERPIFLMNHAIIVVEFR